MSGFMKANELHVIKQFLATWQKDYG